MTDLQLINAILYVAKNGCKWRPLPKAYGNWHTIFVRMNRWSKRDSPEGMKLLFFTPACDYEQSLLMDRAFEGDKMRNVAKELG